MSFWPIDPNRIELDATGVVNPVNEFKQDLDTKRWQNTGVQQTNDEKIPLWEVGVSRLGADRYGNLEELSHMVIVPSRTMPVVERHQPITFENLSRDSYVHKATATERETVTATGIVEA